MSDDDLNALMPRGSEGDRIFNGSAIGSDLGTNNTSIILQQLASLKAETTFGFRRMDEKFSDAKELARTTEQRLVERVRSVENIVVPRAEIVEMSERSRVDREDMRRAITDHNGRIKTLETSTTASDAGKRILWVTLAAVGTIFTAVIAPAALHLLHLS